MANIQNELNNIKNAVFGKDVRNAIHDAIKTCYDDASIVNDNANMEVKIARGVYDTLGDRLNEVDSQLEHKANNNVVVKKGYGTLSDFDEETRAVLLGLEEGQVNAVLGKGNVQNENIAFGAIEEYNLSDKFATKILGKKLYTIGSGTYENASSLVLNYTIPTTVVNKVYFSVKAKSLSSNNSKVRIKMGLNSETSNLKISEQIAFNEIVDINTKFDYSEVETTSVHIHIWVEANDISKESEFCIYDFNLSINDSVIETTPTFSTYNLESITHTIEDYYIMPRIASYQDLNEVKLQLDELENMTTEDIKHYVANTFNYSTGSNREGVSNFFYCNQYTFDNDIIISKIGIPIIATDTGDAIIDYVVIDKDMKVIETGILQCTISSAGTQDVIFDNLDISFPSGSYLGLHYQDEKFKFTYDPSTSFRIRSVNISVNIASFDQDIAGGLNYTLYYRDSKPLSECIDNLVTRDELKLKEDEIISKSGNNRLYGKKIIAIGDSMVQGHSIAKDKGWLSMIANRNNMTFVNYGINGTFMTNRLYGSDKGVVERFVDMDDDADYIIVFAGTNDASASVTIGENNSTNISEFKGALNTICDGLLTKYPTKKIMFITPYYRNDNYIKYINAIEDICSLYGIRVFNNMKNGGVCWKNQAQIEALTLKDTLHLNLTGMEYASYKYEEELKRL